MGRTALRMPTQGTGAIYGALRTPTHHTHTIVLPFNGRLNMCAHLYEPVQRPIDNAGDVFNITSPSIIMDKCVHKITLVLIQVTYFYV